MQLWLRFAPSQHGHWVRMTVHHAHRGDRPEHPDPHAVRSF